MKLQRCPVEARGKLTVTQLASGVFKYSSQLEKQKHSSGQGRNRFYTFYMDYDVCGYV